jgi:hypothetical protein
MIFAICQIATTGALLCYFGIWRRAQTKRRGRSWDDLMECLDLDPVALHPCAEEEAADLWIRIGGARGLWALYRQVPVLLAIADYADALGQKGNEELLSSLRNDALQIRLSVIGILGIYALTHSRSRMAGRVQNSVDAYRGLLGQISEMARGCSASTALALG